MKFSYLHVLLFSALVAFAACEVEPESEGSRGVVCRKLVDLCGRASYSNAEACVAAMEQVESCRLICAARQSTCDGVDACLYLPVGEGLLVDEYCQPTEPVTPGPDTSGPDDPDGGVCYFQYDDGSTSGFGCQAGEDSRESCERWVLDRTLGGSSLVQWDWLPECAAIGCQMGCGPEWWSLY